MTIRGDIQALISARTGASNDVAEALLAEIFETLTSADFLAYMDSTDNIDRNKYLDAIDALCAKCLLVGSGGRI